MQLDEYLIAIGESPDQFALRAGIPSATAHRVAKRGSRPRADIAERIIRASHEKPAPCGGTVELSDLAAKASEQAA